MRNAIYRNKNYRKLLIGNTISSFGDSMYSIALTVSLYEATGNISAVAFMWLILGAIAGILSAPLLLELWGVRLGFMIVFAIVLFGGLTFPVFQKRTSS